MTSFYVWEHGHEIHFQFVYALAHEPNLHQCLALASWYVYQNFAISREKRDPGHQLQFFVSFLTFLNI